jgi:hypothetical protein
MLGITKPSSDKEKNLYKKMNENYHLQN